LSFFCTPDCPSVTTFNPKRLQFDLVLITPCLLPGISRMLFSPNVSDMSFFFTLPFFPLMAFPDLAASRIPDVARIVFVLHFRDLPSAFFLFAPS